MISGSFFALYAGVSLGMPEALLAVLPIARAVIMLIFLFVLAHYLKPKQSKTLMIFGLFLYVGAQVLLLCSQPGQYFTLAVYTIMDASAHSLVMPRKDSLIALVIDKNERARILSLVVGFTNLASAPFGYLVGLMSSANRRYPFMFSTILFIMAIAVMLKYQNTPGHQET